MVGSPGLGTRVQPDVIADLPFVRSQDGDSLSRIQGAASAQSDDQFTFLISGQAGAGLGRSGGRFGFQFVKKDRLETHGL